MNDPAILQELLSFPLSMGEILRNVGVALLCGLIIAGFYVGVTGRFSRSRAFLNAIVVLAMITAVVTMVIGNNLARAFGLVGAMSIIRFRTAVKDVQDIVFIFFSLTIGMAAGVGLAKMAIVGSLFVGGIALALSRFEAPGSFRREYVLQFTWSAEKSDRPPYLGILDRFFARYSLVNAQTGEPGAPVELAYYVRMRWRRDPHAAVEALRNLTGVESVVLLFDENSE